MKKHTRKYLCLLLILVLAFSIPAEITAAPAKSTKLKTPLAKNGRLKVKKTSLLNSKGKPVVLKGVSTHGINWFPEYVNPDSFKTLRDNWRVNCIRLAMYTEEYNGYCSGGSKKDLKSLIDKGVTYATELGMYVIIDWHILSDSNPNKNKKQAISFFKEMAKKYRKNKNVLYEICNEPNGGTSWKDIKSYAKSVIKTIRTYDKKNIILVGTPTWSQDVDTAADSPIKGYSNLMYTFHFYATTHKDNYRSKVEKAIKKGLPVFVSEFGISESSGNGKINKKEANKWIKFLKKRKISFVCWNLSNKNESSALLKSSCQKTKGFKSSDLSAAGKWFKKVL
ncbi:MAG: glycoside hydrolase family 5 protein [Dorea sp.]|nr:glycoside hydrolase family 5 protein [Dorea sp.]